MRRELARLVELDRETVLVGHIGAILGWDQETYMPPAAVAERSEQSAYIESLAHARASSPEIGVLLEALGSTSADPMGDPSLAPDERAYLRVVRRSYDRATKLPAALVAELAREASLGQAVWAEARTKDDFASFAPRLERMVQLKREQASCLAGAGASDGSRYDALLDLFEPGSTEAGIARTFAELRLELVALLGKIRSRPQVDDSFLHRPCPAARQAAISEWLMGLMSYDRSRGRLDTTAHPFTTTLGADDVRITTRYEEGYLASSFFSTAHESGHALYELGIDPGPGWARTGLHEAASMAVHESQSRLWENMVCRSPEFWAGAFPRVAELAGGALDGVGSEAFAKAVNKVEPSLIRVEADEVSYGLHVILRFELESDLVAGRLEARGLPEAWDAKMEEYLGLVPPDDARGCLQDVHWSAGLFGYFPSYALGNLYAAQLWSALRGALPGMDGLVSSLELGPILDWLRAKVHRHGATYLPAELLRRATGAEPDARRFAAYLNEKYAKVYGL
jgi:carboxypeptidase Taq